ncbi:MAG: hypothetical protein ACKO0M_07980 [Cyanobium sp.]
MSVALSGVISWCRRHGLLALALVVSAAFACRSLLLIGATSLWRDELSTAYKVYELSLPSLLTYLGSDSHPPLYYVLHWFLGRQLAPTAFLLRVVSWLAYAAGGVLMAVQAFRLARASGLRRPDRALALALLLAFTTPFPVRFSIEAKGYALLVAWLALALLCRQGVLLAGRRPRAPVFVGYGLALSLAASTHYYGLFYAAALLLLDGWLALRRRVSPDGRRWALAVAAGLAMLPVGGWILFAVNGADAGRATSWIGMPEFGLLEDVLARFLGPWPLPKLIVALTLLVWLQRSGRLSWQGHAALSHPSGASASDLRWLDVSGLQAGLLMSAGVLTVSFWKPIAFARYFIVLLPPLVVWLSCQVARIEPQGRRLRLLLSVGLSLWLLLGWSQSFLGLTRSGSQPGPRENSNYRAVALAAAPWRERYSLTPRHLTTMDRLLAAEGLLPVGREPWRPIRELTDAAAGRPPVLPAEAFVVAATGGESLLERKFQPFIDRLRARAVRCEAVGAVQPNVHVLVCQGPQARDAQQAPFRP